MIYKDYDTIDQNDIDVNAINNALYNIINTRKGSLPGKPYFGSDLDKIVFSQIDHITESLINTYIVSAINEFEPRIRIISTTVKEIPEYNRVVITINYEYKDRGLIKQSSTDLTFNQQG